MMALTRSPTVIGSNGLKTTPRAPAASASHDGAEAEALAAGARGVVFKPFDPMTVGERVKAIIEAR